MLKPLVESIPYSLQPQNLYAVLPHQGALFLDSALKDRHNGRYSFIAFSPFKIIRFKNEGDPFTILSDILKQYQLAPIEDYPPFQGGIAGVFGYELNQYLEKMPPLNSDDLTFPDLMCGVYDLVFAWDHQKEQAWIFSSGFPQVQTEKRVMHAQNRMAWALTFTKDVPDYLPQTALHFDNMISTFTKDSYVQAVQRVKDYIREGDIFEANISQRFSTKAARPFKHYDLYFKLRQVNRAPFAAFFTWQGHTIASASPERFLRLSGKQVETRPIKGTRKRSANPQEDERLAQELTHSEKDIAENVMIVDLMRNDLSRVCLPKSVLVTQLCKLETFASVHHLVSVVHGTLAPQNDAIDLLRATFPGGSITGAPKIRAMEIISELEPLVRGPYCGSIGYIGFNGEMDLSITIRTFSIYKQHVTYQVGGAITIDSDPFEEYEETLTKGKGMKLALGVESELKLDA